MKTMSKAIVGTIAACAMALPAVSPALASDNYNYARAGYDRGHDRGANFAGNRISPQQAIETCTRAAQFSASRAGYRSARVTDIRDVDRNDRGYTIKGRIAVNTMGRAWRRGDADYGRGWNNDHRGWNSSMRGFDSGTFRCKVVAGRVVDLDFGGIRGL